MLEIAGGRKAEVHSAGDLVIAVLTIIVGDYQLAIGGETSPVKPLIGMLLPRGICHHRHGRWIADISIETGPAIGRDAFKDLIAASTDRLDACIQFATIIDINTLRDTAIGGV